MCRLSPQLRVSQNLKSCGRQHTVFFQDALWGLGLGESVLNSLAAVGAVGNGLCL